MVGDHKKASLLGWGEPNKVSSDLILLSSIFSCIDQIAQPLFTSLHSFSPTFGGGTSEWHPLLSVPLSAGGAAPHPSGGNQRAAKRMANWTGGTGAASAQHGSLLEVILTSPSSLSRPPIGAQRQNAVLKKESFSRRLATFHFNIYFSAVAAC